MSKLTAADKAWIERRLNEAVHPVDPAPEFVSRAHDELMQLRIDAARRPPPGILIALICSVCGLIAALLLIGQRKQAR